MSHTRRPAGVNKTSVREFKARNNDETANPMLNNAINRRELVEKIDKIDSMMGFNRMDHGELDGTKPRKGWLVNMHTTTVPSEDYLAGYSGVDYYFIDEEGGTFKSTIQFDPYFFLLVVPGRESEVEETLRKRLESCNIKSINRVVKEDLSLPNHLVGLKKTLLKLIFHNISDLLAARRILSPIIRDNEMQNETRDVYSALKISGLNGNTKFDISHSSTNEYTDPTQLISDIREYDVPYHVRVSIDANIRVGKWYYVYAKHSEVTLVEDKETIAFADPVVLAFDIETCKAPLKFPDSKTDQIMMISYMIDGDGYLITNRNVIAEDIDDFEYTPKPEYPGYFTIFNEADEVLMLKRFFEHIREVRPTVIATFNGDFFDWPYVEDRARQHQLDMFEEIGFAKDNDGEYKSKYCVHMDCFRWVKRDSYLPQGSQGLKAVTTAKLGYNPTELDPELMTPYASEQPQLLSEYSVSDAVATYYLYYKYVHPFIFSLCTIIPLNPDEVLRKGTGTLCEMLLMVQAYQKNILLPNKYTDPIERFFEGHLLESETYVGGHVESLEAGVFRSDLPCKFNVDPSAVQEILDNLHNSLRFCIEVENKKSLDDVENYDEIYNKIKETLLDLKNNPVREENPLIYHVDVASMYPNIMTSNRLQPDSMKSEEDCAACDFNRPGKTCDRRLEWSWRGEFYPTNMGDYNNVKRNLQEANERFQTRSGRRIPFNDMPYPDQAQVIKNRLAEVSKKNYHRLKQSKTVKRDAIVCQRENPFYVNTVRDFRDRRYEFKTLAKVWKGKSSKMDTTDSIGREEAKKMVVLYDSLQLAHKVILNSFYGYVMRKGSRWYSMEMAGITCLTGAKIIQMARSLVERLGRPLELDTDGIWCILPTSFPENYNLKCKDGKKILLEYPCSMLNYLVHQQFTNHQYQDLVDENTFKYSTRSENSIFFEVDGPYKAMILPTSKEEGKGLKKRYAVFNDDGSLAELKGFELKRRGELQLIKNFQSDIFKLFLEGDTLEGCYKAVASVANNWLDVLDTKGGMLEDEDLIELICENRSMSKSLAEYGNQKSTSITTAKRLGEFLGEEMVKDAGLACKYIISAKPVGKPITERAVPVSIFSHEEKQKYLRNWLGDQSLTSFDPRSVIDWDYYYERLASVVQKIITIPAALQGVKNPVPRVDHPDWLRKKVLASEDKKKQSSIGSFFSKASKEDAAAAAAAESRVIKDIEDFGSVEYSTGTRKVSKVTSRKRKGINNANSDPLEEEKIAAILQKPCPKMTEDYAGFLAYQKAKWRVQARNRERRRTLFGPSADTSFRSSVGTLYRRQAESVAGSNWEILQYKPDPSKPGALKVHVFSNNKVHTFSFQIPKIVYAALKSELSPRRRLREARIDPSNAILPNGHDASHLYKITMPEAVFEEEMLLVDSLLQGSTVLGLYETQVSALERAIINLGNTVKFDDTKVGSLGKGLKSGFHLKDLSPVKDETYLRRFKMDICYLLHIVANNYEFYSLFKTWEGSATVYILKPSSGAQELPPNMQRIYEDLFHSKKTKLEATSSILDYSSTMEFDTVYYNDRGKLFKRIDKDLRKLEETRSTKALLAIQSPYANALLSQLKSVQDYPTIRMGMRELKLPAIGWQSLISKRIVNHYFVLGAWIKNLISISKYGNIPLCNLEIDNLGYLIDVEYARRLSMNNVVLWWSPKALPDHGGFENDSAQDYENFDFPQFNNPEVYDTTSLEIELGTLTINTILTSALINGAEGTDLADEVVEFDNNNGAGSIASDSFSAPAMQILRSMVKNWWDDALNNDVNADALMNNLEMWIQRKESHLYDYALHYQVHNLTIKSLLQLLGEFKRLGSNVIFANRNKVILLTPKVSVEQTYASTQYLVKATRAKPLFNFLDMRVVKYWDILVWMDRFNFGGRSCKEITAEENQNLTIESNWLIKKFLPIMFQDEFEDWVLIFIQALAKHKSKTILQSSQMGRTQRVTQIAHRIKGKKEDGEENEEDEYNYDVVDVFRLPLLKRIEKLYRRQNESIINPELEQEYRFPVLPGSHLNMKNPALELVKFLCAVFSLSHRQNIEVRMLRKDLLSIFDVKEFSPEANFKDPCVSLVLSQFRCDYCNHVREIDFCRDTEVDVWNCTNCHKQHNKASLEEQLITQYLKTVTKFQCQDLKCSKCGQIKSDNMSEFCRCSGKWVGTIPYEHIAQELQIYAGVAKAYNLELLRSVGASG